MAHYAFLNENNIVTEVIVGRNEDEVIDGITDWEKWYADFKGQTCKRTSYNGNYRKNYAGIGYEYDEGRDAFIPPKTFDKWILDEKTCRWKAPIPYPNNDNAYTWNDNRCEWEEIL